MSEGWNQCQNNSIISGNAGCDSELNAGSSPISAKVERGYQLISITTLMDMNLASVAYVPHPMVSL